MNEFIETLAERMRVTRASLLAAVADGDDYSADLHAGELQWLDGIAAAHGVVVPAQAAEVVLHAHAPEVVLPGREADLAALPS